MSDLLKELEEDLRKAKCDRDYNARRLEILNEEIDETEFEIDALELEIKKRKEVEAIPPNCNGCKWAKNNDPDPEQIWCDYCTPSQSNHTDQHCIGGEYSDGISGPVEDNYESEANQ